MPGEKYESAQSYKKARVCLHGRVPSVLPVTAVMSGVTTGAAAPTNSVTLFVEESATQTLPEPSMAMPRGY